LGVKFICDDNLGKLAKYLRLLGFDTYFAEPIANADLLKTAAAEERFLITRDRRLMSKSHPFGVLLLEFDDPLAQLAASVTRLKLTIDTARLFSRCSRCNAPTRFVLKAEIAERAFPYILRTQDIISECPLCKRLYWRGTHYIRLLGKLKSAIPGDNVIGQWPE
jgi:uncharacterized protein with PIN domain